MSTQIDNFVKLIITGVEVETIYIEQDINANLIESITQDIVDSSSADFKATTKAEIEATADAGASFMVMIIIVVCVLCGLGAFVCYNKSMDKRIDSASKAVVSVGDATTEVAKHLPPI
jgi:hypothetical protein